MAKKAILQLQKHLQPHGLNVRNSPGHGARICDGERVVAQVHLENDFNVASAIRPLHKRGYAHIPRMR